MGIVEDIETYLKFLTTTSLTVDELNLFITASEKAKHLLRNTKARAGVTMVYTGTDPSKTKAHIDMDMYITPKENGNGGNGHNGNDGQPDRKDNRG